MPAEHDLEARKQLAFESLRAPIEHAGGVCSLHRKAIKNKPDIAATYGHPPIQNKKNNLNTLQVRSRRGM